MSFGTITDEEFEKVVAHSGRLVGLAMESSENTGAADEQIGRAVTVLLSAQKLLPEGVHMKIWLSYTGNLSYSLAVKNKKHSYYDPVWKNMGMRQCKGGDYYNWVLEQYALIKDKYKGK